MNSENTDNPLHITYSLDWTRVSDELYSRIADIPPTYRADLRKMLHNITVMVSVLSQHEVTARRTHNTSAVVAQLEQINRNIVMVDQYIVTAILMG